jgi:phosphoribosylamine--glycine ligase
MNDIMVFHAGTKLQIANGIPHIVTNGGRVLGVTGLGDSIKGAIDRTYKAVEKISFEGMHYRRDIGRKAIVNLQGAAGYSRG